MIQLPKNAYIPENDMWLELIKPGEWQSSNEKQSSKFDKARMTEIAANTAVMIGQGHYPQINFNHERTGSALGLIDKVHYNTEKGSIEGKVAYFTNDAVNMINEGKTPYRSVEITKGDGNEKIVGCALLGFPAIKGMELNPMQLSEEQSNNFIYYSEKKFKMEVNTMPDNASKGLNLETETTSIQQVGQRILNFNESEEYKEFLDLKAKQAEFDKIKEDKLNVEKEFAAFQEQANNEMKGYKTIETDLANVKAALRKKELLSFAEKNKITGYTANEITDYLFSIENSNGEIIKFAEGTTDKAPVEVAKDIISRFAELHKRLSSSEIEPEKFTAGYNPANVEDADIRSYMETNNIESYAEAFTKLTGIKA